MKYFVREEKHHLAKIQNYFSMKLPSQFNLKRFILIIVLALVYYQMAEISRTLASTPQNVTPVWPPDGIASAMVLIYGYWVLPGVFIGSFLSNIWAFTDSSDMWNCFSSIVQVAIIAFGTTAGTYLGVYLLRSRINREYPLGKINNALYFLICIGILGTVVNATVGVSALSLGRKIPINQYNQVWFTWWVSNVSGIFIFTPAVLSWHKYLRYFNYKKIFRRKSRNKTSCNKALELFLLSIIVILICLSSFWNNISFEYMLFPCLIWANFRFGELAITNLIVLISSLAVTGTVRGLGVFSKVSLNESLILLQIFIVVIVFTIIIFNAIVQEKQDAIHKIKVSQEELLKQSRQNKAYANFLADQNIQLKKAKQEAILANKAKSIFLTNMSHELRTPLNGILGVAQLLEDKENLTKKQKEEIRIIYESGNHLLLLINDILDISKIEAGKLEIESEKFHLADFLQVICNLIKGSAQSKNLVSNCSINPELSVIIECDQKRLRQVLLNILGNAVKFTEQGTIKFETNILNQEKKNDILWTQLEFKIEDTGIGIAPDKLDKIFLAFEQVGDKKFQAQGTGLGLAISKKIAQLMGGDITVASELGKGSIFTFTLTVPTYPDKNFPRLSERKSAQANPKFDSQLSEKLPLKILIAEDNLVNQKIVTKIFKRLGYSVDIAVNGLEVLSALENKPYDVIFMDIQMPELDGMEATRLVLEKYSQESPYIIAMTANAIDGDREKCLAIGMKDYISKPIKINAIVEALYKV